MQYKPTTVGILGADWFNKGSEAMLKTVMQEFEKRSDFQFSVFIFNKSLKKLDPFIENYPSIELINKSKTRFISDLVLAGLYKLTKWDYWISKSSNLLHFSKCDTFVDIHGYAFHEKTSFRVTALSLGYIWCVKCLNKQYFFFPQDVGEIKNSFECLLIRLFLPQADMIFVRGSESKRHLQEIIGEDKFIQIIPDIAFVFSSRLPTDKMFREWRNERNKKTIVGISVNKKVVRLNNRKSYNKIIEEVINHLVVKENYSVVLLPHDVRQTRDSHDVRVCLDIYKNISDKVKKDVFVVDNLNYTAGMYKWVIGQCDFVLASRFHVAVGALSQNIPTATLGWSFKYPQLLRWFDLEKFALDGFSASSQDIVEILREIDAEKDVISSKLKKKNKSIKNEVEIFFDNVTQSINRCDIF